MFRTARRLKGHQQQQGSARKQQGSARKQQGSARKQQGSARKQQGSARKQQQQQQHQRPAMSGVTEDIRSFLRRLFWCVAVRRSAGGNGSRTRLDLPWFFPFFPFFSTSGGVASAASGPVCPGFFPCFFHVRRSGVRRIRPDLPLFFPLFFHVRRSGVSRIRPGLPLFFHFFSTSAPGPVCPCFFPFFSTSGGVLGAASGPICPRFSPFFHVRWSGTAPAALLGGRSLRRLLVDFVGHMQKLRGRMEIQGASQACFFFKRLHHLAA